MAVGDRTADSIIWVPGETTGKTYTGASVSAPTTSNQTEGQTYADNAVDVLHDRLVASGILES